MDANITESSMLIALIAYGLCLVLACWFYRPRAGYSDFVVAGKSSGWFMTAFGLFTLIGGGELIAGSSFGYVYRWYGIALFVGYGISFVLLALLAPRLLSRVPPEAVSYVDYATVNYGPWSGWLVFHAQVAAFFALLVLQLSAGGVVISELTPFSYFGAVLFCAGVVGTYLTFGGFRAVMLTDAIQGFVMLLLFGLIGYLLSVERGTEAATPAAVNPGFDASWGVVISGVVIGLASADVWQRLFAARSSASARVGLLAGGIILTLYGTAIVSLGIMAHDQGLAGSADTVFVDTIRARLPASVFFGTVLAAVAAILSTADTEVFLVASLLERRIHGREALSSRSSMSGKPFHKVYVIAVLAAAVVAAYWGSDLATFFNWMFVAYMIFAPTVACSLFADPGGRGFLISFAVTFVMFLLMLAAGSLTLENSYLLTLPAVIIIPLFAWIRRHGR